MSELVAECPYCVGNGWVYRAHHAHFNGEYAPGYWRQQLAMLRLLKLSSISVFPHHSLCICIPGISHSIGQEQALIEGCIVRDTYRSDCERLKAGMACHFPCNISILTSTFLQDYHPADFITFIMWDETPTTLDTIYHNDMTNIWIFTCSSMEWYPITLTNGSRCLANSVVATE